ncbi:MAG: DNA polymerase III subunit gamma/tau [Candidatus Marinimicrobia bacterium]|nr:DNA polymerase III subunit gamma/tau [Candidatus Neomarinimicrobiota bacterium]
MTYQVLSLKWRPQTFDDVVGQDHITQTLKNAFKKDRIAQGYVFTGPRGVGKTTMARLMAKRMNCLSPVDNEPCNHCTNCSEITESRSMDVLEIDGASNRGIDEMRHLRENIKFPPMSAQFKVYIIDEVHMLTNQAFNALLRTLEEPPVHGKFIMCTTDIHKMPATIISRCQRFDFNRISSSIIADRMKHILDVEKIEYDEESVSAISRKADGSVRDALSLLDQVIAFAGDKIVFDEISKILGLIPYDLFFELTTAIKEKNGQQLVSVMNNIRSLGTPLEDVVNGFNQHLRNLLISTVEGAASTLEMNSELQERYTNDSVLWERRDLMRISQVFSKMEPEIRRASQPQILFEINLLKMLEMDKSVTIEELLLSNLGSSSGRKVQYTIPEKKSSQIDLSVSQKIMIGHISEKKENVKPVDGVKKEDTSEKLPEITVNTIHKDSEQSKGSLDLEHIKSNWHQVISKIGSIKTSVAMVLEQTLPMDLNNRKLDIAVYDQPKFSFDRLERNRSLIESTFEEIFNQTVRMTFLLAEDTQEEIKHELPNGPSVPIKGNPVVNRVIELFDGEILR